MNESTISMVMGAIVVVIVGSLVIKYLKSNKGSVTGNTPTNEVSIEQSVKTHTVAKGENLWMIAEKYYGDGFKWIDIATENKLENASIIEVGQEITISDVENTEAVVTNDQIESEDAITSATYEVLEGDSLWKIAIRAYGDGYQWVKIERENKIIHPDLIHPGNVLVLPR